ncbi:MAG: glycosyltransferase family 1 protein [Rhodospirillaceae bacterium]|nr:glycosyltransferase family 1 protein [Rhodospirillaceae bacterium]MBT4464238.1 glycosyltransferase family 1 protein [Rhodospirillaceae bacterium]MBT5308187.1 glycosyltransferase family 1 protein [Rhodospirillaceae bacterium]MBT6406645.1 glycosyltransferase family 1 protein [Rhodospirillaceae bacterium]MBT7357006.1 glycosyltransferase family 1 protein [Rhodospirillaceae bacterium]
MNNTIPPHIAVVGTGNTAAFADTMLADIATALKSRGAAARLFSLQGDGEAELGAYFTERAEKGEDFHVFDLNGNFLVPTPPGTPLKSKFSYVIDHPIYHLGKTRAYTDPMTVAYTDATHMSDHTDIIPDIPALFLPHGGPMPGDAALAMGDRDIDLLFLGNIPDVLVDDVFNGRLGKLPDNLQRLVVGAIERILGGGGYPFAGFRVECGERGIDMFADIDPDTLIYVYSLFENYIAAVHRLDLLQSLSGFKVHLVGKVPDGIELDAPGFVRHGYVPFDQALDMIGRTKILLNMNPQLAAGSHERVWQGMALGCVVLTNNSLFLQDFFTDGREIMYTRSESGPLAERLSAVIGDDARLQGMADAARSLYKNDHTWESRADTIIDTIRRQP